MRRLLVLSYYFGHRTTRLMGLAKHLPRFGWEVDVVTSDPPDDGNAFPNIFPVSSRTQWDAWRTKSPVKVECIPRFIKKAWEEIVCYPDAMKGWLDGWEMPIDLNKADAILSSGPPHSVHAYAKILSEATGIPWIVDLRDPWATSPYYQYHQPRKAFEARLEKRILRGAELVTTSSSWGFALTGLHNRDVDVIPNGFEPYPSGPAPRNDKLSITYAGQLYSDRRDPAPVIKAIKDLGLEEQIQLNLLTFEGDKKLPREKVLEIEAKSDILLLLLWNDRREIGTYTGKLFEYLSMSRPILAIGPERSVVKDLFGETKVGVYCTTIQQIKEQLGRWAEEHRANGFVEYHGIESKVNEYTHEKMAGRFARLFEGVVERTSA